MQKTILVVDDFEDTQVLMKYLLEELGFRVVQAKDGWKALESVTRQIPDLILMDMAMPLVNGVAATKLIRQLKGGSKIPIIAFTASGEYIQQQALDAGCNDFIEKPVDFEQLSKIINEHINT